MLTKKLLFIIVPNYRILDKSNIVNYRPPFLIPPYGALSISTYIKKYSKNKLDIELLDLNEVIYSASIDINDNSSHDDVLSRIHENVISKVNDFKPEIIACSLLFNSGFEYVQTITDALSKVKGDSIVVFGGKVPSNHYRNFLEEYSCIDAVSYGEGEVAFLKLADSDDYTSTISDNISFVTMDKIRANITPKNQLVEDLDDIPIFDFNMLDMDKYVACYVSSFASLEIKFGKVIRGIEVISTRGCPYDCIFCTSHAVHGKKIRYKSAQNIVDEVVYLKHKYDLNIISFQDDNFFHRKERAISILDKLIELDLDVNYEFANGIAIYCIDEDIASRLQKLGVRSVTISVESGSPYVLNKIVRKPLRVDMVEPAVKILRKYDIRAYASFVFGLPGETEEDRQMSLSLIEEVGFDWVHLFAAIPFSGSRLYDICLEKKYITKETNMISATTKYSNSIINTENFTAEYINKFVYSSNLRFNFINNYNVANKNYKLALLFFKKVIQDFTDHAFSHYMIWKTSIMVDDNENAKKHKKIYFEIINSNKFWYDYAMEFALEVK